jgi:xylulokinase
LLFTLNKLIFDTKSYLSPGRHVIKGGWGLLSSIPAGGASVNWFKNNFDYVSNNKLNQREFYTVLEEKAAKIPVGSDGLLFFPHFVGANAPTWETGSRAAVLGLSLHHSSAHIFKALLEGVGFEVMWNIKTFESLGISVKSAVLIGGATKSRIWPQIISDMLNIPLKIPRIQEAACLGAAILAGVGAKVFHDCHDGAEQLVSDYRYVYPEEDNKEQYETFFSSYQRFFRKLREAETEMK